MNEQIKELSPEELKARVDFLSSAKCNHTPHKYIDISGGLIEGTLLSRILYWFSEDKNGKKKVRIFKDGHYWIAKQRKDWKDEIRITERQYDKAIKELKNRGFVELAKYKFNAMPTVHIRPIWENINKSVETWEKELENQIISEYEKEYGNNIKCNSQGNYIKCNSGNTEEGIPLTLPTNTTYTFNNDYCDKDCTLSSTEKKTLPSSGKGVKTSAPNNNINININNIPPRTKEQKQERYAHAKKNHSVDYKDEELPTILYNGFNSLYGDKEDILEDHDICLTMALVKQFFEKFKQYRGERHPIVYANDLDQFLSMIRNADLDMVKDGIVEEDDEPQYYLDMMDEYFGSDIGKNNNMDCDYHIWLFFTEKTQNILYNRVKQKREE